VLRVLIAWFSLVRGLRVDAAAPCTTVEPRLRKRETR
jgi:hypothetical protein